MATVSEKNIWVPQAKNEMFKPSREEIGHHLGYDARGQSQIH